MSLSGEHKEQSGKDQKGMTHGSQHAATLRQAKCQDACYPGLEIIAKLATVLEVQPAELLRASAPKGERESYR